MENTAAKLFKIISGRSILFIPLLLFIACNKNSLQLPEPQQDNLITKTIAVENINKIELVFKQNQYEREGKTSLTFKNLSGKTMTGLVVLIEKYKNKNGSKNYDSISNQSIINIDTLSTNKNFSANLSFNTMTLKSDSFNVQLLSSGELKQINSGYYSSYFVEFQQTNNLPYKYGYASGYISADGSSLLRIKSYDDSYYYVTGNFIDTTLFNNGLIQTMPPSSYTLASVGTLTNTTKRFELTPTSFKFKISLDKPIKDNVNYLLIHLRKN